MATESFSIDLIGENTGKTWKGVFKTKINLSHRDYLRQDQLRRELLGEKPEAAGARAANTAELMAFINIHLVEPTQWWQMNGNGLDLEDDNVVSAIYGKIVELKEAAAKKLVAKAEADKVEIAKAPEQEQK